MSSAYSVMCVQVCNESTLELARIKVQFVCTSGLCWWLAMTALVMMGRSVG